MGLASGVLVALGCNFGAPGGNAVQDSAPGGGEDATAGGSGGLDSSAGPAPGATSGASDTSAFTSGPAVDTTADDAGSTAAPGTSTADGTTTDGTTGAPAGTTAALMGAIVEVSDAPAFDFGDTNVGTSTEHEVTLTNVGDVTATAVMLNVLPAPFSYAGTGTCQGTIEPEASCTIVVVFGPGTPGLVGADMTVEWSGGEQSATSLALAGAGVGSTPNLLQNPGGETSGNPPPSWTELNGTDWQTADWLVVHGGTRAIFAGTGPANQNQFALGQAVDVSGWAETIDAGLLRVTGSAWQLAGEGTNNNQSRVRLLFVDAGGVQLSVQDTPLYGGTSWSEGVLDTLVPAGTRSVSVILRCTKPDGESACDAYFDDASLVVSYP